MSRMPGAGGGEGGTLSNLRVNSMYGLEFDVPYACCRGRGDGGGGGGGEGTLSSVRG